MANNDGIHRIKDVLKKQIGFAFRTYLSIAIILSPLYLINAANAAGLGGWSLGGGVAQGASIVYNGSKEVVLNGAKKLATGVAKITPPPSSVAKALAGGVGAIALDLAIQELLGGVDYVLDPANNSVKYSDPNAGTGQFLFGINDQELAFTPSGACAKSSERTQSQWVGKLRLDSSRGSYGYCISDAFPNGWTIMRYNNPAYDPAAEEENRKSIPLETVAQQVISNAAAGNAAAQQVVKAAADTMVAEAETDSTKARPIINQLEASQSIPTDQTATGETVPKEETGENTGSDAKGSDITLNFPIFCDWAPSVCQAANVVIQKPAEWADSIKAAYDDAVDYFKEEPTESEPEELEIEQPEFEADEVNLQGSTACPQDQVSFSLMGNSYTLDMPYQPVCNALEFFRPAVLTVGAITSAFIVAGIRTKEDEE
ncbi:virulence factor TspB C-terminal domain-related protein [Acinetobacter ursingii]|uniref:virulence factor TspB C-terminal domain-related protein n=1 Tax=Acinetobacter ursingii TaxID=108980 RepID=UPI003AF5FDAE